MDLQLLKFGVTLSFLIVGCSSQIKRTWRFNTNFDNPENWDRHVVPCKTSTVIFPSEKKVPVELPDIKRNGSMVEVNKLILSRDGSLILPYRGGVAFSWLSEQRHASCIGGEFKFVRIGAKKWADPDNWISPSTYSNDATPHLERIPCVNDIVVFPNERSVYVKLPRRQVSVFKIQMQGMTFADPTSWETFLLDGAHSFFPGLLTRGTDMLTVTGDLCNDPSNECECGNSFLYEDLCSEKWKRQESRCAEPVTPIGFCFPICGAFLLYKGSSVGKISPVVRDFVRTKDVEYHVSKANGFIQVVLTEKGDYTGSIDDVVKDLHRHLLNKNLVKDLTSTLHISGLRISQVDVNQVLMRFFFGFFLSLLAVTILFFFYENNSVSWQRLRSMWGGRESERLGFARFENKSGTVEIGKEALASRQDASTPQQVTAFDNPMFSKVMTPSTSGLAHTWERGRKNSYNSSDTDTASLEHTDSTSQEDISMKEVNLETENTSGKKVVEVIGSGPAE